MILRFRDSFAGQELEDEVPDSHNVGIGKKESIITFKIKESSFLDNKLLDQNIQISSPDYSNDGTSITLSADNPDIPSKLPASVKLEVDFKEGNLFLVIVVCMVHVRLMFLLGRHEVKDYCRYLGVGVRCLSCVVPRPSAVDIQIKNLCFFSLLKIELNYLKQCFRY